MKKLIPVLTMLVFVALLSGCSTKGKRGAAGMSAENYLSGVGADNMTEVRSDRMLVWKARLSIQVANVSNAVLEATTLVQREGGFVEQKYDQGEKSALLTLRMPVNKFKPFMSSLETLGTVTARNIEGDDVTEEYIDVEARLKNKILLRDRLQQLLEKATAVKDILAIETELNRVQSDIESMEGRIKSLKGQVDFAAITLNLERKQILGPLGYLFKGLWWGVTKLFIIRD